MTSQQGEGSVEQGQPKALPRRSSRLSSKKRFRKESSQAPSSEPLSRSSSQGAVDRPSVAVKAQTLQNSRVPSGTGPVEDVQLPASAVVVAAQQLDESVASSGLWGLLPEELVEGILKQCTPAQLAMLSSTCAFFHRSKLIEKIAKQRLKAVPRAKGIKPQKKEKETYVSLLHFVNCQSAAAAQATSIACGAFHTAALLIPRNSSSSSDASGLGARHSMYTFGRGFHGQLGNTKFEDEKAPVLVSLGFRPCQDNHEKEEETMPAVVACGAHHTTSISRRGELFAWGLDSSGELGLGRWAPVEVPVPRQCLLSSVRVVSVACGTNHTLAIAEVGTLWSCGKNKFGQLGLGNTIDSSRLLMVQNLSGHRIVSAAAGIGHSMALASDGSLFTWGEGSRGQLGHAQLQQMATPSVHAPILMTMPQKIVRLDPSALSPENRVTAIAAGAYHSMALTVGGAILAFGDNSNGALGLGDVMDRWKPTKVELRLPSMEGRCIRAVQLACGAGHSVALISNQGSLEVWTAGCNTWGQLGLGDRQSRVVFTPTPKVPSVVAVQAGDEHSAAITATGDLYVWGRGDSGQLGLGDMRAKWRPTLVKDFVVVHPDKTLRRSKRNQPYVRPMQGKRPRLDVPF